MKDRIYSVMKQKGMTQQDFAKALNIAPASLSSIFNGRTSPTRNHVEAIHRCFPEINVLWLMFNEGEMYSREDGADSGATSLGGDASAMEGTLQDDLFGGMSPAGGDVGAALLGAPHAGGTPVGNARDAHSNAGVVVREVVKMIDKPQRKISEIRIFYDDGTYETFSGAQ